MTIQPIRTRRFHPNDALTDFLEASLPKRLPEESILVVTSKIVALSEGRTATISPSNTKDKIIAQESRVRLRTPWCWLTRVNGEWCANAGVDASNANGSLILLPRDSQKTSSMILRWAKKRYARKRLGVIITDTRIYPLRVGTMGVALGWAGFEPIRSYIGEPDLFGRVLRHTRANIVHALAVAAVLTMGEGREQTPVAIIHDAPVRFGRGTMTVRDLAIDPRRDLYRLAYQATAAFRSSPTNRSRRK